MDISNLLWTIHIIGYTLTLLSAIRTESRAEKKSELVSNCALFGLIAWPIKIFDIIERNNEINIEHARIILNGGSPPTPKQIAQRSAEKRNIRKAWDKYYAYMGERHSLGMSHPHPGPEVPEPSTRDPRGEPRCTRGCTELEHNGYYSFKSTCDRPGHMYPEPSTSRLAHLLEATVKATEDARRKKAARIEQIRLEYAALGHSPTESGLDAGPD